MFGNSPLSWSITRSAIVPIEAAKLPASPKLAELSGVEAMIRATLKRQRTPFMLIRRGVLERQFQRFRKCLPEVMPYYAIKANPHPKVIQTFIKLGAGFDVASAAEMKQVLSLGAPRDKIIFANTVKSAEDIAAARRRQVRLMTFDNEPELYKIAEHYPGAHVVLRIKVGNEGSLVNLSLKFGADAEDAHLILRKAQSLGLVPTGISFHVGSQSKNVENYLQALEISAHIFDQAEEDGLALRIMDIGGGFPIQHFDNEIGVNFERMAMQIRKQIRQLFDKKVQFIAEPGRFMVGPAGILVTQVIGRT